MTGIHAPSRPAEALRNLALGGGQRGTGAEPKVDRPETLGGAQALDGADDLGAGPGPKQQGCGCGCAQAKAGDDALGERPPAPSAPKPVADAPQPEAPKVPPAEASKNAPKPPAGPPKAPEGGAVEQLKNEGVKQLPGESSHNGLQPKSLTVLGSAQAGGLKLISGLRAGDPQGHGNGSAVDVANVPGGSRQGSAEMDRFAESARAAGKAGDENYGYVIYKQRIASAASGWEWKPMEDRGSNTANHFDHVHVSTDPKR